MYKYYTYVLVKNRKFFLSWSNININLLTMSEMELKAIVERIVNYKTISQKEKIDRLLEMTADIWSNQGIDSTKTEKADARKRARVIYRGIKELDNEMGTLFLRVQDKDV